MLLYILIFLLSGHTASLYSMKTEESSESSQHVQTAPKEVIKVENKFASFFKREDGTYEITMKEHGHSSHSINIPLIFRAQTTMCTIKNHYTDCHARCLQEAVKVVEDEHLSLRLLLTSDLIKLTGRFRHAIPIGRVTPVRPISTGDHPLSAYGMRLCVIQKAITPSLPLGTDKNDRHRTRSRHNHKTIKPIA